MSRLVRVVAIGVVRRPSDGALLVGVDRDPATGVVFHRPLGGTVEFGERSAAAVTREFNEEIGHTVRVAGLLGVLENFFEFGGEPGHEIVFVHEAAFDESSVYSRDEVLFLEDPAVTVMWRPADATQPVLYPTGLDRLIAD